MKRDPDSMTEDEWDVYASRRRVQESIRDCVVYLSGTSLSGLLSDISECEREVPQLRAWCKRARKAYPILRARAIARGMEVSEYIIPWGKHN